MVPPRVVQVFIAHAGSVQTQGEERPWAFRAQGLVVREGGYWLLEPSGWVFISEKTVLMNRPSGEICGPDNAIYITIKLV